MKFDRSNKFDFCYYGQVNSLLLKSSVALKWASKHLWGTIYFAGDGTLLFLGLWHVHIFCSNALVRVDFEYDRNWMINLFTFF